MTNQPVRPLSDEDIEEYTDSDSGVIRVSRLRELFAELKKRKELPRKNSIVYVILWEDIEELFAPLMPPEELRKK